MILAMDVSLNTSRTWFVVGALEFRSRTCFAGLVDATKLIRGGSGRYRPASRTVAATVAFQQISISHNKVSS